LLSKYYRRYLDTLGIAMNRTEMNLHSLPSRAAPDDTCCACASLSQIILCRRAVALLCPIAAAFGVATVLAAPCATAQSYPLRTITWIVPFAPGGITDITSRLVAKNLSVDLGQQVIIENKPGAGGSVGTEQVARGLPDGHTLLYGTLGTMAANPILYKSVRYQPMRDFTPVHGMFSSPNVIVANPSRSYTTLTAFIDFARANPGKLSMASAGPGTGTHLAGELMQLTTGVKMVHVPYKGSAPALTDLIGGQTDVMFDYAVSSGPHVKAGKLRGLAVAGPSRLALLPDVPTTVEAGVQGIESSSWSGVFVASKTPANIVTRLTRSMELAMASADVTKYSEQHGSRILAGLHGAKFSAFVEAEMGRWGEVVRRADIRLD
jgi:tripartite-type tricarboxylate transporter receptor subunit TctC